MDNLAVFADLMAKAGVVDLSHTLEEGIPFVASHSHFHLMPWASQANGDLANHNQLLLHEHHGTHIDAPVHFFGEGGKGVSLEQLPLESFYGECAVLDLSFLARGEAAAAGHILEWEKSNGRLKRGDAALCYFGQEKLWALAPNHREFMRDFAGLGGGAAELLRERGVKIVGCDTASIEASTHQGHPAHRALLGSGVLIVENLANLGKLPPRCYFLCLPLPIKGGTGSPIRAVAILP